MIFGNKKKEIPHFEVPIIKEEMTLAKLRKMWPDLFNQMEAPEKELIELKHKYKMEELAYERETSKLRFDFSMQEVRLQNANVRTQNEIRFEQQRKIEEMKGKRWSPKG